jgi:competence protein ComEA
MGRREDQVLARLAVLAAGWTPPILAEPPRRPDARRPGAPRPGSSGPPLTRQPSDVEGESAASLDDAPLMESDSGRSAPGSSEVAPGGPLAALSRRSVGALALVIGLAILAAGAWAVMWQPRPMAAAPAAVAASASATNLPTALLGQASASPSPSELVVHVAGPVVHPGVVRLSPGSRVIDAISAAGGLRKGAKLGATNLARPLMDGERVDIGASTSQAAQSSAGSAAGQLGIPGSEPLDLNTATAEQLDTLPGIGPVTAAKILAWRATNGRFSSVEELTEVPGIGPKTLAELRSHVRV